MLTDLRNFLSQHISAARETDIWGDIRLEVNTYLTDQLPPLELVTSVRAIVRQVAAVLTLKDPDRTHILPGGRREANETIEQTLRREILEETGWEVGAPRLIGCMHFQHLTPKPDDYVYPYPDFLQLVYSVDAARYVPEARQSEDYVLSAEFLPLNELEKLSLSRSEQVLLAGAAGQRAPRG